MDGRIKFGPNTIYIDSKTDYSISQERRDEMYQAALKIFPWLKNEDIEPEMTGIRPKIQGPGDIWRDFIIKDETDKGFPGFINCIGIESPGLTACLAIGEMVTGLIQEAG